MKITKTEDFSKELSCNTRELITLINSMVEFAPCKDKVILCQDCGLDKVTGEDGIPLCAYALLDKCRDYLLFLSFQEYLEWEE